jgi:hypothetical protein
MRTGCLPFVVAALVAYAVVVPATAVHAGGYFPIDSLNDPHIQELGRWAVSQFDKISNSGLMFNSVVGGEQQVVAGMRYHLIIDASNPNGKYWADVYEDLSNTRTRTLFSFHLNN